MPEARRFAAALAASDWPEREQAIKPYRPHRVAGHARELLAPHRHHPAVHAVAQSIESHGLTGSLSLALQPDSNLAASLAGFERDASLDRFWSLTAPDWTQAEADLSSVMARADLAGLLEVAFEDVPQPLRLVPNLLFPGMRSVATAGPEGVTALVPPPKAWGSSLPWRYSERADEALAAACVVFAEAILRRSRPNEGEAGWGERAGKALAVILLREVEGGPAAESYLLMERKSPGLAQLPEVVRAVEAHVADQRAGRQSNLSQRLAGPWSET